MMKSVMLFLSGSIALMLLGCSSSGNGNTDAASDIGSDNGTTEKALIELFPTDNELSGWAEDTSKDLNEGVFITECLEPSGSGCVVDLVDGEVDQYKLVGGFAKMGREYYKKDPFSLSLVITEMTDNAKVNALYTELLSYPGFSSFSFSDLSFGGGEDHGRSATVTSQFHLFHAVKGKFLIESHVRPETADAKTAGQEFIKAVLMKIP